ncbi:MAG: AroM family protein [Trueperaceae bacterium]|nr:MAG: AroM family protein [Trueperaceae bacterium]
MRVGAVTVGQSPRSDITPEIAPLLPGVEILEGGALDGLGPEELEALRRQPRGEVLATRLRSGQEIVVGKDDVLPGVADQIARLERSGAEAILLLCTGSFPVMASTVPVLYPEAVLAQVVRAVFAGGRLGVLTPHPAQCAFQVKRWGEVVPGAVKAVAASPYPADAAAGLAEAAEELSAWGADLVAMDCLGYTTGMRDALRRRLERPVLLARTALARVTAELLGL